MTTPSQLTVFLELPEYCEIAGSPSQLRKLARLIRDSRGSVSVVPGGPEQVHTISVVESETAVAIRYSSGVLSIECAREGRDILASNIKFVARSDQRGQHLHIEHHEDHFYLSRESIPLIVKHLPEE